MKRNVKTGLIGLWIATAMLLGGCGGGGSSSALSTTPDATRTVSVGIEVTPSMAPTIWIAPNSLTTTTTTSPLVVAVMPIGYVDSTTTDTPLDDFSSDDTAATSRGWYSWFNSAPKVAVAAPKRIWVTYSELYQPKSLPGTLEGHLLSAIKQAAYGNNAPKMALAVTDEQLPKPQRDHQWTVQWANFDGAGKDAVGAAFVWLDGTRIVEADLAFNVKYDWSKSNGNGNANGNARNYQWFRGEVQRVVDQMISGGRSAAVDSEADIDSEIVAGDGTSIAAPSTDKRRWRWLAWRAGR